MKSLNFKNSIAYLATSLTIFSSLSGLNCAKVNAAPTPNESQSTTGVRNEDIIFFTIGDMKNLLANLESILNSFVKSSKITYRASLLSYPMGVSYNFDKFLETKAHIKIPNFNNLRRISGNATIWFEPMRIYLRITQGILKEDLDENLKDKIRIILNDDDLIIGNTLNEIRKIMVDKDIPVEVKEEKYLIAIINFLKTFKPEDNEKVSDKKLKKLSRFEYATFKLMQIPQKSPDAEQEVEEIVANYPDPEIKTVAEIVLENIMARKNLELATTERSSAEITVNQIEEKMKKLHRKKTTELLEKELKNAQLNLLNAMKNENLATEALMKAIEKMYIIEKIPKEMLMEELKGLI